MERAGASRVGIEMRIRMNCDAAEMAEEEKAPEEGRREEWSVLLALHGMVAWVQGRGFPAFLYSSSTLPYFYPFLSSHDFVQGFAVVLLGRGVVRLVMGWIGNGTIT